jgi:hypothetical protein
MHSSRPVLDTIPHNFPLFSLSEGVAREIEALQLIARSWPSKRKQLLAATSAAARAEEEAEAAAAGRQGITFVPIKDAAMRAAAGGGGARRDTKNSIVNGLEVAAVAGGGGGVGSDGTAAATFAWLKGFDMELQLLTQLQTLFPRLRSATGGELFSGKIRGQYMSNVAKHPAQIYIQLHCSQCFQCHTLCYVTRPEVKS